MFNHNHNFLENIYNINYKFNYFWIMFYKNKNLLSLDEIVFQLNNYNSKYFAVINDIVTCTDPFLYEYNDKLYIYFEKINNNRKT